MLGVGTGVGDDPFSSLLPDGDGEGELLTDGEGDSDTLTEGEGDEDWPTYIEDPLFRDLDSI